MIMSSFISYLIGTFHRSTAEHYLDISPEATFKRLVIDKKGGTYCYGHNGLMLEILRSLAYR